MEDLADSIIQDYNDAIARRDIDPLRTSIDSYAEMQLDAEVELGSNSSQEEEHKEIQDSARQIANLQKGGEDRENVLQKWFGNLFE